MKKIKSFIYLDNYKMYSISSQIFEGLTEYVIKSETKGASENTQQKGDFGSGRVMADIIESNATNTEKKFLHDYAYTLFENDLTKENRILEINSENIEDNIKRIDEFSFVKITNRVSFNDAKMLAESIGSFNQFGEAITYVVHKSEYQKHQDLASEMLKSAKDNKERAAAQQILKNKFNVRELAKTMNLNLDDLYLKNLEYLISYGYNDQFELQMPFETLGGHFLFSCLMDRKFLLESEISLITKYARETEKTFTILGVPTQTKDVNEKFLLYKKFSEELESKSANVVLKEAVMNVVSHLGGLQSTFTGKLPYEYIIDPIAVYREL